MDKKIFISICIPSYNRPEDLKRLLKSVDSKNDNVEIVIREDKAPLRQEVRRVVDDFKRTTKYKVTYIENEINYGYDKNLRNVGKVAQGEWIIMMGDDDAFVPGSLDQYIEFLESHDNLGYVLRRYLKIYSDGKQEDYRYDNKNVFLKPGEDTIVELFRRSLFISGFTYRKNFFSGFDCDKYDGTLLFQLYILAEICMSHPAAYCDIPITQSYEGGTPYFGISESEKKLYESGKNTINNSLNFMMQVEMMAKGIDEELNTNMEDRIIKSYSKYSYGFLYEHRDEGLKQWNQYVIGLKKLGFASSPYFYLYYLLLLLFGKKNSQKIIRRIKKIIGKTPRL